MESLEVVVELSKEEEESIELVVVLKLLVVVEVLEVSVEIVELVKGAVVTGSLVEDVDAAEVIDDEIPVVIEGLSSINLAPQIPPLETAAPRTDLR